jgi:hypothetical protein
MATFVEDCHLEAVALNLRIEGRTAAPERRTRVTLPPSPI